MVKGIRKGVITPSYLFSIVLLNILSACSIQKAQKHYYKPLRLRAHMWVLQCTMIPSKLGLINTKAITILHPLATLKFWLLM